MVSPRKRSTAVSRLRSSPKSKSDSSEDWISASNFQFAESPVIPRRKVSAGRPKKINTSQNRRLSMALKRLDLPLNGVSTSPYSNVRKTRRQSMAPSAASRGLRLAFREAGKPVSPQEEAEPTSSKLEKSNAKIAKLPPKKAGPEKERSPKSKLSSNVGVSLSPMVFYSSPEKKRNVSLTNSVRPTAGKRKVDSEIITNKVESSPKKVKTDSSAIPKVEKQASPIKKVESSSMQSPSPVTKRTLRSAIPRRTVLSSKIIASSPLKKLKSFNSPKKIKKVEPEKIVTPKSQQIEKSLKTPRVATKANVKTIAVSKSLKKVETPNSPKKVETPNSPKKIETPKKVGTSKSEKKVETPNSPKKVETPEKVGSSKSEKKVETLNSPKKVETSKKVGSSKSEKKVETLNSPKKVETPKKVGSSKSEQKVETLNSPKKVETPKNVGKPKSEKQVEIPKSIKKVGRAKSPKNVETTKSVKRVEVPNSPQKKENLGKAKLTSPKKLRSGSLSPKISTIQQKPVSVKSPVKTSPKASKKTPEKKQDSPIGKVVKIKTPVSAKRLQSPSLERNRITRSSARGSRKVTLIGDSPKNFPSSFRKTPGSNKKSLQEMDDVGASPLLSARSQLEIIRCRSPLRTKRKSLGSKVKPFTPKPDSPPSHILRKTMKKKVAQKMHATTKVEIHQLMNGEISRPVTYVSGNKTVTVTQTKISSPSVVAPLVTPRKALPSKLTDNAQNISVTAVTPVSVSNLPPTPTSSRKQLESVLSSRSITSRTTKTLSCQRALTATIPRSSTPIEEDDILEPLSVGAIIEKMEEESNFTDDSINTDESEDESSITEINEKKSPTPEKSKRGYCALM